MADIALACVVGSLIGAGLLAYWLSRRLVSPLVELTGKVNRGEALDDTLLCSRDDEVVIWRGLSQGGSRPCESF